VPEANTDAMQQFLDGFAKQLPKNEVAALFLDRAGWHRSKKLVVPQNVVLFPLPAYSPELNPIERIWLHLKERFLSHRLHDDYNAILDAVCDAWNRLTAEAGRITSLCAFPWIEKLTRAAVRT
jgi:transposase